MKKQTLLLSLLLLVGAANCHAQLAASYRGTYKASLDAEGLLASLAADTSSSSYTVTVSHTATPSANSTDFQKEAQQKVAELIDLNLSKGYTLQSADASLRTAAYDIITLKANALENANPLTQKTEVLYEWADSDVTPTENGLLIRATNGTSLTLERLTPTTLRIPELHLILTAQTK